MKLLEERLRMLPRRPGVYLFRTSAGEVLYVGKAKSLPPRVRSYFRTRHEPGSRLAQMVQRIHDIETIVTGSETEALILEANLVKEHRPRYNVFLKDDKSYPFLQVTTGHPFPGLFLTRRVIADGSRYFGPYTFVKGLRRTLKGLRGVFRLRNCTDQRLESGGRECLEYFIERCPAPCTARIDQADYGAIVARLLRFLGGDVGGVVEEMRARMLACSREARFEEAARLRDDIATLERLGLLQRMTPALQSDTDVVALVRRGARACCVAMHVRDGKVLGKEQRIVLRASETEEPEILRLFLIDLYGGAQDPPDLILTSLAPSEAPLLEGWLSSRRGAAVRIRPVRAGAKRGLLDLARENAHLGLEEEELRQRKRRTLVDPGIYELQERLGLPRIPYRIEGFDISNLQATYAVAAQVCFQDGSPLKSAYRRYRIKQVQGPDDVAMMEEVLRRRLGRLRQDGGAGPDLILVDGGRGQVGRAVAVLEQAGLGEIAVLGLAKREEQLVIPGVSEPLRLPRNSDALRLLQRVRDEAHRFALSYHRSIRGKGQTRSALDPLMGVGRVRRARLLERFGSVEGVRRASVEALVRVPGIGPRIARRIKEGLGAAEIPRAEISGGTVDES